MSAELLRETAAAMRADHGPQHERHKMWEAMADWLDFVAKGREALDSNPAGVPRRQPSQLFRDTEAQALAVARAYLGRDA